MSQMINQKKCLKYQSIWALFIFKIPLNEIFIKLFSSIICDQKKVQTRLNLFHEINNITWLNALELNIINP
jgi:hypothetical protein